MNTKSFQKHIYAYYSRSKREFPWRYEHNPYKIMVSEIMLQQTQVSRVLVKYPQFIDRFPKVQSLAESSLGDIFLVWQGMGYNRRAKFLRDAGQRIVSLYGARVPADVETLTTLPGIGHATASAIVTYAWNKPTVFIETNIRAVFLYHFFHGKDQVSDTQITHLAEKTLDRENPRDWYYALTDYGAMLKKHKKFRNSQSKHYGKQSAFEGSNRQLRGKILKLLLKNGHISIASLRRKLSNDPRIDMILSDLVSEKMLMRKGARISFSA